MNNSPSIRQNLLQGTRACVRNAALLAVLTAAALAQAASGTFTYVTGNVYIVSQGRQIPATRGMEVNAGDLVVTKGDGMAQLAMIDQAKLSLRSNSQLRIESYPSTATGQEGATLSLLRGTLRTFTGLLTPASREKYAMRTRVATVGIRGSGNILNHEENDDGSAPVTINHTIEGSHVVTSLLGNFAPVVTFPNDTVRIEVGKPPERIPTPPTILAAATTMTTKEAAPTATAAASTSTSAGSTSSSGSGSTGNTDPNANTNTATSTASTASTVTSTTSTGTTAAGTLTGSGQGGSLVVTTAPAVPPVAATDSTGLRDVVIVGNGSTSNSQALTSQIVFDTTSTTAVRGYQSYVGSQANVTATVAGGTATEVQTLDLGSGAQIVLGRWNNVSNLVLPGMSGTPAGSVHFIYGTSGFPAYLSDVLTGTATYTKIGATTPTDQAGALGTLTTATLDVNFTTRLLNATLGISMPAAAGNAATTYTLTAGNVPFAFNTFIAIAGINLNITNNGNGATAASGQIFGTLEGSFVGASLNGVIIGYGFSDSSVTTTRNVNGVVAFQGPSQSTNTSYRDGLVSDPNAVLAVATYQRSFATTDRPDEVNIDTAGKSITFNAPFVQNGQIVGHLPYAIGTAQAADLGTDPTTGLTWGRWTGGTATIGGQLTSLAGRSMHYIFSTTETGPVTLPLTGTGTYDVVGSTKPTDLSGNVGTLNSATLNANFTAKTVDTSVNVTIAGQTWNAAATNVPIYRDQYFSAYGGAPALNRPALLNITCTPSCTPINAPGSIDGFFTGRTGAGAGVMYNINNTIAGAIAFARRGG